MTRRLGTGARAPKYSILYQAPAHQVETYALQQMLTAYCITQRAAHGKRSPGALASPTHKTSLNTRRAPSARPPRLLDKSQPACAKLVPAGRTDRNADRQWSTKRDTTCKSQPIAKALGGHIGPDPTTRRTRRNDAFENGPTNRPCQWLGLHHVGGFDQCCQTAALHYLSREAI